MSRVHLPVTAQGVAFAPPPSAAIPHAGVPVQPGASSSSVLAGGHRPHDRSEACHAVSRARWRAVVGGRMPSATRLTRMPRSLVLCACVCATLALSGAPLGAADAAALTGTWRSTRDEVPLSTAFDESVWGKGAKSVRTVEMVVRAGGEATLTITRSVVDARGRTVPGSTSVEHADLVIGAVQTSNDVRSTLGVTVKRAERRYPDDPQGTWVLDGLRVAVATFSDDTARIEVRVDTPEGRGSFWETLRRGGRRR